MFSEILLFLINILFSLFGIALILRAWLYAVRLHPFNPFSQAILRITDWLIQPIRKVLNPGRRIDWPSLLASWITAFLFLLISWVLLTGQLPEPARWGPAVLAAVMTVLKWAFNVLLWVTLIQAILSWINPLAPVMPVLQTLTAPLLDPIRRVLPNLGGLDLSPLVLLLAAQVAMMIMQRIAFSLFGI